MSHYKISYFMSYNWCAYCTLLGPLLKMYSYCTEVREQRSLCSHYLSPPWLLRSLLLIDVSSFTNV